MTQSTPQDRIRIFNKERFPVAEFRASVERSWALGDEGRAQFSYASIKTDIVNKNVLQFGNYLLVENDTLPPWVGVIDTPRTWSAQKVTVSAYTAEKILSWRRGPIERIVNAPAGAMFEYLVNLTNLAQPTALKVGDIWRGGRARQETFNPNSLADYLRKIQEGSGEEYTFTPYIETDGKLSILCNWYQRAGIDYDILLHQGRHGGNIEASDRILVEDGDIYNDILGYGDGLAWTSRITSTRPDPQSILDYGLRQTSINYYGVTTAAGIASNLVDEVNSKRNPSNRFEIIAINEGDTFKFLNIGNGATLQLQNIGFQNVNIGYTSKIRILGMSYKPEDSKNKIKLVVEIPQ